MPSFLVIVIRSEEHTSELQSLTNLVCRLLLEKKITDNIQCIRKYTLQITILSGDIHLLPSLSKRNYEQAFKKIKNYILDVDIYFFFNDTATTEIYTLSLHDALPIWQARRGQSGDFSRLYVAESVPS